MPLDEAEEVYGHYMEVVVVAEAVLHVRRQ